MTAVAILLKEENELALLCPLSPDGCVSTAAKQKQKQTKKIGGIRLHECV